MVLRILKIDRTIITCLIYITAFSMPVLGKTDSSRSSIHQFKVQGINGNVVDLSSYRGKILLIVNTASYCGFTSQYKSLQKTHDQFKDREFSVLAFPSNDFGRQEPGSNKEIKDFCELNYKVSFPLFSKVTVSGDHKAPLFKFLTEESGEAFRGSITWNFEKFLIEKSGAVIARFKPSVDPQSDEVVSAITKALSSPKKKTASNGGL